MRDVATGASVACSVTEDALAKLSGGRSSIAALDAMFDQHRAVVENIASSKYDAGRAAPHIREQDVALPM
jgi:hypothetical protein